ncbi:hypothetical protein QYF61_013949 [Mycteria americana]|uniref:Uncharacterized protein n=1 Tax=Mycteria americana TaxID=33587 RepID=A0AAN7MLD9_MYCAM|nr:hypothetical protein QYF61_013949 [Mycteria americana]
MDSTSITFAGPIRAVLTRPFEPPNRNTCPGSALQADRFCRAKQSLCPQGSGVQGMNHLLCSHSSSRAVLQLSSHMPTSLCRAQGLTPTAWQWLTPQQPVAGGPAPHTTFNQHQTRASAMELNEGVLGKGNVGVRCVARAKSAGNGFGFAQKSLP